MSKSICKAGLSVFLLSLHYSAHPAMDMFYFFFTIIGIFVFLVFGND